MKIPNAPRVGQKIADVSQEGGGLIAKMSLWLQQQLYLLNRNPTNTVAGQVVGASPYTYTNNGDFDVTALVTGGTVTAVEFSRDGTNFFTVSTATNASVTLNPGDSVRITYGVLPTLTLVPR
jgi:hypothetical protein